MQKEVWIVVGRVSNPDAYETAVAFGQPEYQFSDGPIGKRTTSADYVDLIKGLKEYSGYIIHFEEN